MPNYRRARVKGGTFFFTVVSYQRRPILCHDPIRGALRQAIRSVQTERPFNIDAWVLLPDHLHCIWTLPFDDSDFSTRWAMIKRHVTLATTKRVSCSAAHGAVRVRFSQHAELGAEGRISHAARNGARSAPYISGSRVKRHEGYLWQRRFWEHAILDQEDFKRCIDYLHWNPVKHGYVSRVADWSFSTFHRYVRQGVYGRDWGGDIGVDIREFGE